MQALIELGFKLENMGGNCSGYLRSEGETETLVTRLDDASAPDHMNEAVCVTVWDVESGSQLRSDRDFFTVTEAVEYLRTTK